MKKHNISFYSILFIPMLLLFSNNGNESVTADSSFSNDFEEAPADCYSGQLSFKGGEELVYKLYYNWNFIWIPAGEAVFKVEDRFTYYNVTVTGTTYDSYSKLFEIDDHFESKIDKKTLLPIEFTRNINEGGYTIYNHIKFDQSQNKLVSNKGKTKSDVKAKHFEYENCMHDIISVLYYMRSMDYTKLKKKQYIPVDFYMDHKHYGVNVLYNGEIKKKNIKGLGSFNVLEVSPIITDTSLFKEDELTKVYASNDDNKVPLLIESPLTIGSVKAVLISHKGLKNSSIKY